MKKAKRRKEFEETKSFVRQINTHGDITLSDVLDCVNPKKLSLEKVEPVINAINPRHNDAIYKRPKGHVVTPGTTKSIETNIRFVLPQILVKKAQTAGLNAVFREHSISGRTPPREDIIISILEVGTFSLTDIDAMHEWHCLKKKISATRKLIKWIMTKPETETRGVIISRVSKMNMFSAFKSKVGETIVQFDDLTRFAGEMWLSDGCVFVSTLILADSCTRKNHHGRITSVHVVDPVFLEFGDPNDRKRMIDSSGVLSRVVDTRVILVPVYIDVDIKHWCAAVIDMGSKIIWIYDPKTREDYLDVVETIMKEKIVPLVDKECVLTIRRCSAWHQTDGYNCGVLVVKWFEAFLNVATNTKLGEDLTELTPEQISVEDLNECRYKMFQSVFMDVSTG
ncbi:hypothetical protein PF003_g31081 [Phytophthora fragariae]|nr:hypothetical protein PF003_g31081 [Phytophthora fragariae]